MAEKEDPPPQEDKNYWRRNKAEKLSVLIDGESYFREARRAMIKAKRRICLLAWEFHSQTILERDEVDDGYPTEIGPLLNQLLEEKEELEVYILVWDYALIYISEREWRIFSEWQKTPHPRMCFVSDKTAPSGASHHQKTLTIDDSLAFCGGLDLSISRWDTTEHLPSDERRVDPNGKPYKPYHDIHSVMTGPVVADWQELFQARWHSATGDELDPLPNDSQSDLWPEEREVDFEDVDVSIYKIQASPTGSPTQIEQLHIDLFKAAQRFIYIENQYLSSQSLCETIAGRLEEESGPEVVIILPSETSGWLVESTVGLLRDRLLEKLFEADKHDRLRVYGPHCFDQDVGEVPIYVHAKLVIVDDRIIKVGSSNLSNRSMNVDSECDFTLAFNNSQSRIKSIRQKLISGHFGIPPEEWSKLESEKDRLTAAFDAREGEKSDRSLRPIEYGCESDLKRKLADTQLLDPEDPIDPEFLIQKNIDEEERPQVWKHTITLVASLVSAAILGVAIYWISGSHFGKEDAVEFARAIADNPWSPIIIFALFSLGGTCGIPLNFMLVTTAVTLGSRIAIYSGVSGALVSACLGFGLGHLLGKPLIRKIGLKSVDAVSRKLGERSFRSVAFIRLIPVAPFFVVNMVAGASHLKFKQYLLGTVLGMTPGMCSVVLVANRVEAVARQPSWFTAITLAIVVGALVLLVGYLRRSLALPSAKQ